MFHDECWMNTQVVAIEKADQCDELMRALELSTAVGKAAEHKLEELLHEKKDVLLKNELLEQQVTSPFPTLWIHSVQIELKRPESVTYLHSA